MAALLVLEGVTLLALAVIGLLLYKQHQQLRSLREQHKEIHEAVKRGRVHTTKSVDEVAKREFRQFEALLDLRELLDLKEPLGITRGWAASPDLLLALAGLIAAEKPSVILECGGGTSTTVIAKMASQYGGRVITLEHQQQFLEATQADLDRHGLTAFVDLRLAPLIDIPDLTFQGEHFRWYDPDVLADIPEVDLFFIDGPPESTGRYARYPALPLLWSKASDRVKVLLDDTIRADESEISAAWATTYGLTRESWPMEKGADLLERPAGKQGEGYMSDNSPE
jgi:hypothetical protein